MIDVVVDVGISNSNSIIFCTDYVDMYIYTMSRNDLIDSDDSDYERAPIQQEVSSCLSGREILFDVLAHNIGCPVRFRGNLRVARPVNYGNMQSSYLMLYTDACGREHWLKKMYYDHVSRCINTGFMSSDFLHVDVIYEFDDHIIIGVGSVHGTDNGTRIKIWKMTPRRIPWWLRWF